MQRTTFVILFWALIFAGHLNGQDIETRSSIEPKAETATQVDLPESVLDEKSPALEGDPKEDQEPEELGPAVVSVNELGELVGRSTGTVNGDEVPIEANITLVSGGVLLAKTVASEDGSFSFPNVHPGDYNIYGCASSFCGDRACTVVTDRSRFEPVQIHLDQTSACGCNIGYAEAPATSFNGGGLGGGVGSGGFGGGSGFGGGGGGGVASSGGVLGRRGFRLLAVGGIATAIALGASDDD